MTLTQLMRRWAPRIACGAAALLLTSSTSANEHCAKRRGYALPHSIAPAHPPAEARPLTPHDPSWSPPAAPPVGPSVPYDTSPADPNVAPPRPSETDSSDVPPAPALPSDSGTALPDAPAATMQGNNLPEPMTNFDQGLAANTGQGFDLGLGGGGQDVAFNQTPMVGDNFGGGSATIFVPGPPIPYFAPGFGTGGGGGIGAAVGLIKQGENGVVLPTDRVYVNFSSFDDVRLIPGGLDVQRVTAGAEVTFLDGLGSVEFLLPFASTLSSEHTFGTQAQDNWEVGNAIITPKFLLYQDQEFAVSAGMGVLLPTADDFNYTVGANQLTYENDAVHLLPFLGAQWTPNDSFYLTAFAQLDIDAGGNDVLANGTPIGELDDPLFLYLDIAAGMYVYRDSSADSIFDIAGIIPTVELHYNQSLEGTDSLNAAGYNIGNGEQYISSVNGLVGVHFQLGNGSVVSAAYVAPLAGGVGHQFDGEFRLMVNLCYGNGGDGGFFGPVGF